jgi:hypothetical protein
VNEKKGGTGSGLCPSSHSGIMRGLMRKHLQTEEEKAAKKIATVISDVRLDLDEVGISLSHLPNVVIRRLSLIAESAEAERESQYDREHIPYLF